MPRGDEADPGATSSGPGRVLRLRLALGSYWQRLVSLEAIWVVIFVIVGLWVLLPLRTFFAPQVQAGDIASRAYVASRDLLEDDLETTREKQDTARAAVLPVYDLDPVIGDLGDEFLQIFEVGRASLAETAEGRDESGTIVDGEDPDGTVRQSALSELLAASTLEIDDSQLDLLMRREFSHALEDRLRGLLLQLMRRGVVSEKGRLLENRERGITVRDLQTGVERVDVDLYRRVGYPDEVAEFVEEESSGWTDLSRADRLTLRELVVNSVRPNLQLNRSETRARRNAAAEATVPVVRRVRAGQIIVRKGDLIGPIFAAFINGSRGSQRLADIAIPALGKLLLLSLGVFVIWLILRRDGCNVDTGPRVLSGLLIILTLGLLIVRFAFLTAAALGGFFETAPFNSPDGFIFAVPFAMVGLITFVLYGRPLALLSSLVFSVIASQFVVGGSLSVVIFSLAGSMAAIYFLGNVKRRSGITRTGLVIGVVNMSSVLMILALASDGMPDVKLVTLSVVCGLAGGLAVAAVTSFALPVLEWLLELTTDVTLIELSNTNLPVLRRLAFEAPGTFQHSLMVANLAKGGCAEIDANAILAYTGGLYHDIGKVFRPDYFIENQRPDSNPHDKLAPSMSSLIVIKHVTEGLELANHTGLPRVVRDAIAQHHGTHLLKFFHSRAVEREGEAAVNEEAYRYPGPKPQNKVMGVLMLADAVEAASRTLHDTTPEKVHNLVSTIFDAHIQDGQLEETDLTLADIKKVGAEFERILGTVHHRRVDYPGFDFDVETDGRRLRAVEPL